METTTYEAVINHKKISEVERLEDLLKLVEWKAESNDRKICGNKIIYHHQLENLVNTRYRNRFTLKEIFENENERQKLFNEVNKRKRHGNFENRIYECFRVNRSPVVFFKPSTAKYLYKKYKATHVLDFTAGWGGRMLGAWALDIHYTGIDTNLNMKIPYENMLNDMGNPNEIQMIWKNCLDVDFAEIDYDFVLTSPPYYNLEIYDNMTPFKNKEQYYKTFLIPMINKCRSNIKRNGIVGINISPGMYKELLSYKYEECFATEDLVQNFRNGKDKGDKIYFWNKL